MVVGGRKRVRGIIAIGNPRLNRGIKRLVEDEGRMRLRGVANKGKPRLNRGVKKLVGILSHCRDKRGRELEDLKNLLRPRLERGDTPDENDR